MNAGYLSLILLCITLILFASGWKELYVRSISHKGMLLFFALWIVGSCFSVSIKQVYIQLVYMLVFCLYRAKNDDYSASGLHRLSKYDKKLDRAKRRLEKVMDWFYAHRYTIGIVVGVIFGILARLNMLRTDYRQYPTYP